MQLLDNFGRQCDVLESTEIRLHIIYSILQATDQEADLLEYFGQCFDPTHLCFIFDQNQFGQELTDDFMYSENIYKSHQRLMPEKVNSQIKKNLLPKVTQYLKQLNLSELQWKFPGSVVMWHPINARPYGSHGDIRQRQTLHITGALELDGKVGFYSSSFWTIKTAELFSQKHECK